jgi:hypothetical protein
MSLLFTTGVSTTMTYWDLLWGIMLSCCMWSCGIFSTEKYIDKGTTVDKDPDEVETSDGDGEESHEEMQASDDEAQGSDEETLSVSDDETQESYESHQSNNRVGTHGKKFKYLVDGYGSSNDEYYSSNSGSENSNDDELSKCSRINSNETLGTCKNYRESIYSFCNSCSACMGGGGGGGACGGRTQSCHQD